MMIEISVNKVSHSRIGEVDIENPAFGKEFTDHMFIVDYENGEWKDARIVPYGNMSVSPALSCFHYGQAIFEGMKAFKSPEGEILLFRPEENLKRLNRSAERMCMATIPEELFMKGLETWLKIEKDWIPTGHEGALYIRPFMIGTDDYLGVKASEKFRLVIYGCPVGAYYSQRLRIKIEEKYVRAAAGGVGAAKTAGNYAASMYPARIQQKEGFHQLLWTDALEHKYLEELGTSNFFAYIDGKLITPMLDGTILEGITRESVIDLCRYKGIEVEEKKFTVQELISALREGRVMGCFATGTAATIADIGAIGFRDEVFDIPVKENGFVQTLKTEIKDIQAGRIEDPLHWRHVVSETAPAE